MHSLHCAYVGWQARIVTARKTSLKLHRLAEGSSPSIVSINWSKAIPANRHRFFDDGSAMSSKANWKFRRTSRRQNSKRSSHIPGGHDYDGMAILVAGLHTNFARYRNSGQSDARPTILVESTDSPRIEPTDDGRRG